MISHVTVHPIFFDFRRMRMHNICIVGIEIGLPAVPHAGCAATCIREKAPNLRCSSGPLTAGEWAGKEGNQHPQSIVRLDYSQQPYMPSSAIDTKPRPTPYLLTSPHVRGLGGETIAIGWLIWLNWWGCGLWRRRVQWGSQVAAPYM